MSLETNKAVIISKFTNPSGEIVFRVSGWVEGVRIRKNFSTRPEAEAEKQILQIQQVQAQTGVRTAATRLNDDQLLEAESMFRRIAGQSCSLTFFVEFALTNYRPPANQKLLADAVTEYVAAKEPEYEQDFLSALQLSRIQCDLKKLLRHFPKKAISELTVAGLVSFLEVGRPGLKTYDNRRGILSTFFKFSFHREWIAENPILKVPHHRIRRRRGMAKTFTADQAAALMEYFETFEEGRWIPYFALCLFAGIRPGVPHGEISKLHRDAVDLESGLISISAEVSKIREPRKVTVQPNLAAWLKAYPLSEFPIVVGNFQIRRAKFRDQFQLTHDVLRHTFISMFVAKFRSIGEAAIQAGNSESIIRKHYLDMKNAVEAEKFYAILPKHATAIVPVVPSAETQSTAA